MPSDVQTDYMTTLIRGKNWLSTSVLHIHTIGVIGTTLKLPRTLRTLSSRVATPAYLQAIAIAITYPIFFFTYARIGLYFLPHFWASGYYLSSFLLLLLLAFFLKTRGDIESKLHLTFLSHISYSVPELSSQSNECKIFFL